MAAAPAEGNVDDYYGTVPDQTTGSEWDESEDTQNTEECEYDGGDH